MTDPADLVVVGAEVRTLDADETIAEAIAVRDGRILKVGSMADVDRLKGVETTVIEAEGGCIVPGFIDSHTHLLSTGRHLVYIDLTGTHTREAALDALRSADDDGWIVGFGYDESDWAGGGRLTRDELDTVSDDRPVVAFRVDMHTASINTAAYEIVEDQLDQADVVHESGEPNGIILEDAVGIVKRAATADGDERALILAAAEKATSLGVTGIHEMVRNPRAARAYHDLAQTDDLPLRVRLNYWSDHLDALEEIGVITNHGSEFVRVGAVKTFTDGSIGGRTAKVTEPYLDEDGTGTWVVDPTDLRELVQRADDGGFQLTIHAIGDEAIDVTLDALEDTTHPEESRHRIEHVELASDEHLDRLAASGIVASMQPNFLRWAGNDGLYDQSLGEERSRASNRFRDHLDAGVTVAFGSDCMPIDPLYGIHCAATARDARQRLPVTEAMRAYTIGAAYAGFDEHRLGTLEVGKCADFVLLDASPWETDRIDQIDVNATIVDGMVVYER